jgi:hypothetical protein
MRDTAKSFDGSAIDAYWTTKDFTLGAANSDKKVSEMWLETVPETGASLDIGYSVNKSTSYTTTSVSLAGTGSYLNQKLSLGAGYAKGRYMRFRLRNSDDEETFKVNGLSIYGTVEPRY